MVKLMVKEIRKKVVRLDVVEKKNELMGMAYSKEPTIILRWSEVGVT